MADTKRLEDRKAAIEKIIKGRCEQIDAQAAELKRRAAEIFAAELADIEGKLKAGAE